MTASTIQTSPIADWTRDQLGDVFLHEIYPLLTHDVLADGVSLVCKQWKKWADGAPVWTPKHLSQLNVHIISRHFIEQELKRALSPESFAQLSFEIIPHEIDFRLTLIKAARFIEGIKKAGTAVEGDEGLFIIPRPQGLALNMLLTAYRNRFQYNRELLLELGGKKSEGGQYMITGNILEQTRGKTFDEQQALSKRAGGDLPEILNAIFYALMTEKITEDIGSFTRSGNNLFDNEHPFSTGQSSYTFRPLNSDHRLTYMRCKEKLQWSLILGGFGPSGLNVYCGFDFGSDGGGALWKF